MEKFVNNFHDSKNSNTNRVVANYLNGTYFDIFKTTSKIRFLFIVGSFFDVLPLAKFGYFPF